MTEKPCFDELDSIRNNAIRIIKEVESAKKAAGRNDKVSIMAVTKTVSPEKVNIAVESGISLLGENRVQEFLSKHEKYTPKAEIHFIGGLQKNKVKYIIDKVNMIHSVDNERLLSEIERRAEQHDLVMDILLEINIAGETTKNGISPDEFPLLLEKALSLEHIRVRGLMTIPPVNENGSNELYFHKMKTLFDKTKEELKNQEFNILSMGMSQDYALAIRHGSTLVRIGSALFGQRTYVSN